MAAGLPRTACGLGLSLLLWACPVAPKQVLPPLERAKDEMTDKDIVLEGDNKIWMRLPRPFFKPGDPRPVPPKANFSDQTVRNKSSVMVLIASLSEKKVGTTLFTMFQNAVLPSRVFVGIVQQNRRGEPDALEELCRRLGKPLVLKPNFLGRKSLNVRQEDEGAWGHERYTPESMAACEPATRVRMHRMDASEAKGPAYARAHQPRLLGRGGALEDFCLQIDAHTVFVKGWDDHLIYEWRVTENEYAVLTTYPLSASRTDAKDGKEPINDQGRWAMPHLCKASFEGPGVVRNSIAGAVANLQTPALTKFWAAGLSFSKCHAERDVPNDLGLTHIFSGEEFSRAARLWTNGYDMYSMMRPYVVTYYGAEKGGAGSWKTNATERSKAWARLATLLRHRSADRSPEAVAALKGFDLGTRRRYEDYMKLTGMNTVDNTVEDTPCAVVNWTPWLEGSQPPYEKLKGSPDEAAEDAGAMAGEAAEEEQVPDEAGVEDSEGQEGKDDIEDFAGLEGEQDWDESGEAQGEEGGQGGGVGGHDRGEDGDGEWIPEARPQGHVEHQLRGAAEGAERGSADGAGHPANAPPAAAGPAAAAAPAEAAPAHFLQAPVPEGGRSGRVPLAAVLALPLLPLGAFAARRYCQRHHAEKTT